ncbi:hypothetical protein EHM69_01855 [candidate division KSB1 bacterium]|nr:MAG: hypothetical protein EHM69_01855 [candidate division KSB1 bacterium]
MKRSLILGSLLAAMVSGMLFAGCVQTSLVYDPNTYHTGRTSGKGKTRAQLVGAYGPTIRNDDDNPGFKTEHPHESFIIATGLSSGLSDRADLGGTFNLGFSWGGFSTGVRFFLKYMFTDTQAVTSASIMPAAVYILGSSDRDEANDREASSHLWAFELHVPVSYRVNENVSLITEPKILMLLHRARFEVGPQDYSIMSRSIEDNWLCPAVAFGIKAGPVLPEVTFISLDGSLKFTGGVGISF